MLLGEDFLGNLVDIVVKQLEATLKFNIDSLHEIEEKPKRKGNRKNM